MNPDDDWEVAAGEAVRRASKLPGPGWDRPIIPLAPEEQVRWDLLLGPSLSLDEIVARPWSGLDDRGNVVEPAPGATAQLPVLASGPAPEATAKATPLDAARLQLGAAAVLTPTRACELLPMGETAAMLWLRRNDLIRRVGAADVVIWGDVLEAIKSDPPERPKRRQHDAPTPLRRASLS